MTNLSLKERESIAQQAIKKGKKLVLYLAKDADNTQYRYRVYNPLQATLQSKQWQTVYFFNNELHVARRYLAQATTVVIERQNPSGKTVPNFIRAAQQQGLYVAFDLDDLVFDYRYLRTLMRATGQHNFLRWALYFYRVRRIAKLVDGFIATNEFLAQKLRGSFHKPCAIIRNSLNTEQVQLSQKLAATKQQGKDAAHTNFTIGYFSGSPTHTKDFASVEPALMRFLRVHQDVQLLIVGHMKLSKDVQRLMHAGRVKLHPPVDYLKLQELMANVDVNIAPLLINDFTNCKSELKFFEAAAVTTTTIASPTYIFKHAIQDGKTGLLAKQNADWYQKLKYLYQHPAQNRELARAAQESALQHYHGTEFLSELESTYAQLYQGNAHKVSVVVPNYNYAHYLPKRLQSIIRQTYPLYELIILDDCSTDDSHKVIKQQIQLLQKQRPHLAVKFIPNDKNSGKAILQWQKAFAAATGDYIWLAEADDLSKPDFLQTAMQGFANSDVVLSYTNSTAINQRGIIIVPSLSWLVDKERTGHFKQNYVLDGTEEIRRIMAIRCSIRNVSSAVFKNTKDIPYAKYLAQAAKFKQVGDWYLYLQILRHGKIAYHKKSLNLFRLHGNNATKQSQQDGLHYREVLDLHQYILQEFSIPKSVQKMMLAEEARIKRKHGLDN